MQFRNKGVFTNMTLYTIASYVTEMANNEMAKVLKTVHNFRDACAVHIYCGLRVSEAM